MDIERDSKRESERDTAGIATSSSSSLLLSSLELSDTKVYEPYIRALLGTASHFSEVGDRNLSHGVEEHERAHRGQPGRTLAVPAIFFM